MLLGGLQEDLLVLLCYDKERASIIRGVIDPALFGGPYRIIVARVYDYIDRYKKPPGDHLADLLSDKLDSENKREGTLFLDIIESIHGNRKNVNPEYGMARLETFVKRQSLRGVAIDLAKALQKDTEESLQEAESLIAGANHVSMSVFDPGTRLSDKTRVLKFLDSSVAAFEMGIPELDKRNFGPTRKEMWLYLANTKAGKTWALIQLGKMAAIHRLKVCHITLEMSEDRCAQRYMQSLFAISKRKETFRTTRFEKDNLGRMTGFEDVRVTPKLTFDDPKIKAKLGAKIDKWGTRLLDNIIIKQFPTGALTVGQLKAYLDNLEVSEQFVPDLLILDYPDLMKLDKDNFRLALDEIYKDLRGIAVSRNMALAIVSQTHRGAAKSKQVGADNVAEAYSKIAHADVIITYSQTAHEQKLGLARLHVAGGRNDQDRITIVISQQYGFGGFVVDSTLLIGNYWDNIPQDGGGDG